MKQQEYLETLTEQLRCKKARPMVEEEIRSHIEDQKCAYMADGMEEMRAEEEAVRQMGDPVEAGIELDRIHKPQMAWDMIFLAVFLGGIGLLIQYLLSVHSGQSSFMPVPAKAVIYFAVGIVVMIGICMLDYSRIGKWAKVIYLVLAGVSILCLLINGTGFMHSIYLNVPFYGSFNLSGLLPLFVPLYGAILYGYRGQGYRAVGKSILWALPVFLETLLSVNPPMMAVIGLSFGVTLAVAVYRNWFRVSRKLILCILGTVAVMTPVVLVNLIALFGKAYMKERLQFWLHPFQVEEDYQYGRFTWEFLSNNQWIGMNRLLDTGEWTADKLPVSNDYTLSYISSYYGTLAAIVIVGLILLLFLRGIHFAASQKNQLGMIMGSGCAVVLLIQFAFYVLCNLGFLPSAIYCPFITYGGTGMFTTCILLGIMLSVYRYQNITGELKTEKKFIFKVDERNYN